MEHGVAQDKHPLRQGGSFGPYSDPSRRQHPIPQAAENESALEVSKAAPSRDLRYRSVAADPDRLKVVDTQPDHFARSVGQKRYRPTGA